MARYKLNIPQYLKLQSQLLLLHYFLLLFATILMFAGIAMHTTIPLWCLYSIITMSGFSIKII